MTSTAHSGRLRSRYESVVARRTIALAAPGGLFGLWSIWQLPMSTLWCSVWSVVLLLALGALVCTLLKAVNMPLRGLANVVEAYRGGDYTIRGNRSIAGDALGDLVAEINSLGGTLHEQRLKAIEVTALLDKLIGAIGVAVLAFDGERRLRLCNPAAARLLGLAVGGEGGRAASDLGLESLLSDTMRMQIVTTIAGRSGRWQVTHGTFRESGLAQHLLIISDVQPVLREEERAAWQRLIRVMGHEVNNSLAPIKSMAESLHSLLSDVLADGKMRNDTLDALRVVGERAAGLGRFLAQYSRLARVPTAHSRWQPLAPVLARVAALETMQRMKIEVAENLEACIDADQLEQALINLGKNAVEAQEGRDGEARIEARARGADLIIAITDDGVGVANLDNLFVPFFTTKRGGSGVGLVLSRQLVEAHGGTLSLENRGGRPGAVATLVIPGAARLPARLRAEQ